MKLHEQLNALLEIGNQCLEDNDIEGLIAVRILIRRVYSINGITREISVIDNAPFAKCNKLIYEINKRLLPAYKYTHK